MHFWKICCFVLPIMLHLFHRSCGCVTDGDCAEGLCLGGACDCPEKRYGVFCAKDCTADEHCNGGKCIKDNTCMCPDGQYGIHCEDFCTSHSDCSGGGQCVVRNAVKICDCKGLYYGMHCEAAHECNLETSCEGERRCDMEQEPYVCVAGNSSGSSPLMQPVVVDKGDICQCSGAPWTSQESVLSSCLGFVTVCILSLL